MGQWVKMAKIQLDGLAQDYGTLSANALEIPQSYAEPYKSYYVEYSVVSVWVLTQLFTNQIYAFA